MLHHYLQKALINYDSIGTLQFLNVIRICRGQVPIRNGVEGDSHYASVAMRERNSLLKLLENVDIVNSDNSEEDEVEEIAALYEVKL